MAGLSAGGQFKAHRRAEAVAPEPTVKDLFPHLTDEAAAQLAVESAARQDAAKGRPVWTARQLNDVLRGHDFYPDAARLERIPDMYATDGRTAGPAGKVLHEHYFGPTGDFYVCELDQNTGEAFGIFVNQYRDAELTYVTLTHLEAERATSHEGLPLIFERDLHFSSSRAYDAIPDVYGARVPERLDHPAFESLQDAFAAWSEAVRGEDAAAAATHRKRWETALGRNGLTVVSPIPGSFQSQAIANAEGFTDPEVG